MTNQNDRFRQARLNQFRQGFAHAKSGGGLEVHYGQRFAVGYRCGQHEATHGTAARAYAELTGKPLAGQSDG